MVSYYFTMSNADDWKLLEDLGVLIDHETHIEKLEGKLKVINDSINQYNENKLKIKIREKELNKLIEEIKINISQHEKIKSDEIHKINNTKNTINNIKNTIYLKQTKLNKLATTYDKEYNKYFENAKYKAGLLDIVLMRSNFSCFCLYSQEIEISTLNREIKELNETIPPIPSSIFDPTIIEEQNKKLKEHNLELSDLTKKIKDIESLLSKDMYCTLGHLESLKNQIEIIPAYKEYASENCIQWNELDDLIYECNCHKQDSLLEGKHVDETHYGCSYGCSGWTVGNHRCDCGHYKGFTWNADNFNPYSIEDFNIHSNEPYGDVSRQW